MDKNKAISGYEKIFDDGYRDGRESVVLPHPCDGELYKHWTAADYFAKIAEEHLEVIDAYKTIEKSGKCPTEEEKEHLLKECTDMIIATTTLMNYFGYDEEARQKKMKEVNDDNAKRDGGKRFKKHPLDVIEERFYKGKTFSASNTEAKKEHLDNFCGLENCFISGGNEWSPRQISWFCKGCCHNYMLYVNENVLGDGLKERYLEYYPEDTDFNGYDAWLNTEEGHKIIEYELTYWLMFCLDGGNTDSHFVEVFDK